MRTATKGPNGTTKQSFHMRKDQQALFKNKPLLVQRYTHIKQICTALSFIQVKQEKTAVGEKTNINSKQCLRMYNFTMSAPFRCFIKILFTFVVEV